jgi:hypothetical protein
MAEELPKTNENAEMPGSAVYRQVAPAGLAAEVTAEDPAAGGTAAALGRFLTETLAGDPESRERVAALSGLAVSDLASLMDGHPLFPLDTDHVQRIATALVEAQVIPHADVVWKAIPPSSSADYILPPAQVVQAMSGNS